MISEDEAESVSPRQLESHSEGTDMAEMSSSGSVTSGGNKKKRGMVLPFQPLSLAFNHVNYYVDMPAVSV